MRRKYFAKTIRILVITLLSLPGITWAGELFIVPASPLVAVGEELTLTVLNANGDVMLNNVPKGDTKLERASITYQAPNTHLIDRLTLQDSFGNTGSVTIAVMEKEYLNDMFSRENANWKTYKTKTTPNALLLSDDKMTLWVGTNYNFQERDSIHGQIKKIYSKENGFSFNGVETLVSDNEGGCWIGTGTSSGLIHLNSDASLENFTVDNSLLPSNSISSLASDGRGGIWVGSSRAGLAHFKNDGTWEVFTSDNSGLPNDRVGALLGDRQGGIWIGTSRAGLAHFKSDGSWKVFNDYNSDLPDNNVKTLISDGKGGVWVDSSGDHLAHLLPDGTWELLNKENPNLPSKYVRTLLSDDKGGIWIGTSGGLAHLKADGSWDEFNLDNSDLPDNGIGALVSDGEGGIWIGTYGGLAHLTSNGAWEVVRENHLEYTSCSHNIIDNPSDIWVRDDDAIAHLMSNGTWEMLNDKNSHVPHHAVNTISTFISDNKGGIWIGIDCMGLAHLTLDGKWVLFNENNSGLPGTSINALLSDGQGGAWIGTYDDGLVHHKSDGTWTLLDKYNSGLPENHITALLSDGKGGIWIGIGILYPNDGALAHLKSDGTWEVFDKSNSDLPSNGVTALLFEPYESANIWIGTSNGLAHLNSNDQTWRIFNKSNSDLPGNYIVTLQSDIQGGVWVGISRSGIAHLKSDGSWERFDETNSGLPNDEVNYIQSDGQGGIWVGAGYGRDLAHLSYSSNIIENEQFLTGQRAAIVIAGGENTNKNMLWDSTAKISNFIYKMLKKRGFFNTDIHYISPENRADFNGDHLNDGIVDAPKPHGELTTQDIPDAFHWAENRGQLNQPLYVFFTGRYGDNRLKLSEDVYMEAEELKQILDTYQQKTGNKVILAIDASHSGTMLPSLAGPDRSVISSADNGFAYLDRYEGQGFMYFLAKGLYMGMNYFHAFHYAVDNQEKLLCQPSGDAMAAEENRALYVQNPRYDDTGDGRYVMEEDGIWLKEVAVNGPGNIMDAHLEIEPRIDSKIIAAQREIRLTVQAEGVSGEICRAWAVIRPPQMDIPVDGLGIPLLSLPKVELTPSKSEEHVWEGTWDGSVYNGEYRIIFYAEDNQKNVESSDSVMLTMKDAMECPQNASVKVKTNKKLYHPGDPLKISLIENLSYGYDLYVALVMPDGRFITFDGRNRFSLEFNKPDSWWSANRNQGDETMVLEISPLGGVAKGEYCVYAILSPERQGVSNTISDQPIDAVCFEVE